MRVLVLLALLLLAGCNRGMEHQPAKRPLTGSPLFPDGMASRPEVPGAVAREDEASGPVATGNAGGKLVAEVPVPVTAETVARGREQYRIFCAVCHGEDGAGKGIVVTRGFPAPATFHSDRLRAAPAGYFFDVMTRGSGTMYGMADRIPVADRWAIVAYIRALQLSQHAPAAALTPELRRRLDAGGAP